MTVTTGGSAMIETLSLEQLSHESDEVVMASVVAVKNTEKTPEGVQIVANLIQIEQNFKGELEPEEKIKIKTFSGVEDDVGFTQGKKYLLFLQKQNGYYIITNSVQGSWPVNEQGKFEGMGTGITLEAVKEAITTKPVKPVNKVPDLKL
jgi:hypothetical protein